MTAGDHSSAANRGLNKLMLIGEIGRDPEMRYTAHGVPVTTFSMASSRTWVDSDGERQEATDWFNVVAWRHLAESCYECLRKGARVYVEGRLQTRSFDVEDGSRQYQVEVVAQDMILLDGPGTEPDTEPVAVPDTEPIAEHVAVGAENEPPEIVPSVTDAAETDHHDSDAAIEAVE